LVTQFIEAPLGLGLNVVSAGGDLQLDSRSNNLNIFATTGAVSIFNDFTSGIEIGVDGSITQPVISLSAELNLGASAVVTIDSVQGSAGQVMIANADGTMDWGANGGGVTSATAGDNIVCDPTSGDVVVSLASFVTLPSLETTTSLEVRGTLSDGTPSVGSAGQVLSSTGSGVQWVDLPIADAGLQNRLQIVPTEYDRLVATIYSGSVTTPSSWLPDETTYQPSVSFVGGGWGAFKEVGTSGASTQIQWSPYNPYFGQALPYTIPPVNPIMKKDLNTLYAVIRTKNRINVQGTIFFNVYTYDITTAPGLDFYTNRFDYSMSIYPTAWGGSTTTSATLAGGYKYLIYACDTPKTTQQTLTTINAVNAIEGQTYMIQVVGTTNWTAIGASVATIGCVFVKNATPATGTGTCNIEVNTGILIGNGLSATSTDSGVQVGLKDPYDIFTELPHIPFNAVAVASKEPQPADITNIAISKIVIGTTSGALGGAGANAQPTLEFVIEHIGYSGNKNVPGTLYENNGFELLYGSPP